MTRIFFYELKRLLWNQFFVGILAVILFTGWQILNQVTLLGIEQTAPFSVQSFCDYLLRLLPFYGLVPCSFCHSSFQNRNREHL